MSIENWLYGLLADPHHIDGTKCAPPGSSQKLKWSGQMSERRVVSTSCNDGFDVGFGTPDEWYCFYRMDEALRVAWFILWTWWAKATWFGLKRAIWYWLLHRRVERARLPHGGTQ